MVTGEEVSILKMTAYFHSTMNCSEKFKENLILHAVNPFISRRQHREQSEMLKHTVEKSLKTSLKFTHTDQNTDPAWEKWSITMYQ